MVRITELDKIGYDQRGYTYEYFHERMGRHIVIFRKAQTVSGNHYHKGLSLTKNPEMLLLLSGAITIRYKEAQQSSIKSVQITVPSQIEIFPYVWHEVYCHTDCTMLELNAISEHEMDTFYDMNPE